MCDLNLQKETSMPVVTNYSEIHKIFLAFISPSQSFAASRLNHTKLVMFNYFFICKMVPSLGVNLHFGGKQTFKYFKFEVLK